MPACPFISASFDDNGANDFGSVQAVLKRQGGSTGGNDLLIATIALANTFALVTTNTSEIGRIRGLRLENWEV